MENTSLLGKLKNRYKEEIDKKKIIKGSEGIDTKNKEVLKGDEENDTRKKLHKAAINYN